MDVAWDALQLGVRVGDAAGNGNSDVSISPIVEVANVDRTKRTFVTHP